MIPPRREIASGSGWRVLDIVCSSGPADRRVEEWYDVVNIALVTDGTFTYRSQQGSSAMAPGGVVLGNPETCFECGHEHGVGDRCLAFHFTPAVFEEIASATPGVATFAFSLASLPPLEALAPILAHAEAARDDASAPWEEIAFDVATQVAAIAAGSEGRPSSTRATDQRRVGETIRRIEANPFDDFSLAGLAREAGMSRFHFLRVFREVAGVTPHQFVLHRRLHRAAVHIRRSDRPISAIVFEAGFEDLSTFNRRFRRVMGLSPTAYRAGR